jgi:hypothetical protein
MINDVHFVGILTNLECQYITLE